MVSLQVDSQMCLPEQTKGVLFGPLNLVGHRIRRDKERRRRPQSLELFVGRPIHEVLELATSFILTEPRLDLPSDASERSSRSIRCTFGNR